LHSLEFARAIVPRRRHSEQITGRGVLVEQELRARLQLINRSRFHRQLLHTPSFLLQRRRFHGKMIPAASAFGPTG
jgi:hypothetical protein